MRQFVTLGLAVVVACGIALTAGCESDAGNTALLGTAVGAGVGALAGGDTEGGHDHALGQCGSSAPRLASVQDVEAEPVHEGVAEHVQGVTEQGRGTREEPRSELDAEHGDVDHQHGD